MTVVPTATPDGKAVYQFGNVYFEITPGTGARITADRYAGKDLLTSSSVNPTNYGSTFWPSPQSTWNWPPLAEIDTSAYSGTINGPELALASSVTTNANVKISVTKTFSADAAKEAIQVVYTIKNEDTKAQQVAPWEISRVFPSGLTFYPTGGPPTQIGSRPLPTTTDGAGCTWFNYDAASISADQ